MNKNELVELEIVDLGTDGQGIGKSNGFTLFVKDTVPGDVVEAKVIKLKKNYGYARVERVIKPSSFRVDPKCQYARSCGGCQLQQIDYKKQLEFKHNKVRNNLIRIGGIDEKYLDGIMEPILGADDIYGYRNKAQFPFGTDKDGNIICGFYAGRTHSIIANTDCQLGSKDNREILQKVLEYMQSEKVAPYDETTGKGLVRHVLIRKGHHTSELMVCLVINGDKLPASSKLIDMLTTDKNVVSISISINKKNTNVIMGDNYKTIYGKDTIDDTLLGLKFSISPLSFYQVNSVQVEKLYSLALDYANLTGSEEVWDICCGIGTITLCAADRMRRVKEQNGITSGNRGFVHGLEIVPQAIEDAKQNAVRNNIDNVDFVCAAAEDYLPANADKIKADVIILDPPRKGMEEEALRIVAGAKPEKIVYVSCDSATLARDVKYLEENGYKLTKVRACDMFPQTVHVETVVLLSRLRQKPDDYIDVDVDVAELESTSAEALKVRGTFA